MMLKNDCNIVSRPLLTLGLAVTVTTIALAISELILLIVNVEWMLYTIPAVLWVLFTYESIRKMQVEYKTLRRMCKLCTSSIKYIPRRFTYICQAGGGYFCYSSALDEVYLLSILSRESERKHSEWMPLDFYCVKPLSGKVKECSLNSKFNLKTFSGEYLMVDPFENSILKVNGSFAYERSPNREKIGEWLKLSSVCLESAINAE